MPAIHEEAGSPRPLTKTMRCAFCGSNVPGMKVHEMGALGLDGVVTKDGDAIAGRSEMYCGMRKYREVMMGPRENWKSLVTEIVDQNLLNEDGYSVKQPQKLLLCM